MNSLHQNILWLMLTDTSENTPRGHWFFTLAIAGNGILYALVGTLIWCVKPLIVVLEALLKSSLSSRL